VTEVFAKGKVDANITRRVCLQVMAAESAGADVILGVCNSVTEAVETASRLSSVPVVLIDGPMARKLAREASRVGVVGTSWLSAPSLARLIKREAAEADREVTVIERVSREAFEAIRVGDFATHDRLVEEEVRRLAPEVDVVALSQGSMARVLPRLADLDRPIFTSPRLAVERVRELLAARAGA
jgi:aspartate/glutamate racemase